MLVVSRKVDETIVVGDDITIMIVEVKGPVVRLGIEAPRGVRILRGELVTEEVEPLADPARPTIAVVEGRVCRVCGCSDLCACPGGCYWVEEDLCSTCEKKIMRAGGIILP